MNTNPSNSLICTRIALDDGTSTRPLGFSPKHAVLFLALLALMPLGLRAQPLGREVGLDRHLQNGQEYELNTLQLLLRGGKIFEAIWTPQEGGGRPLTKGVGAPLSDPDAPLVFPRNFNRLSAPDANSCAGCHNRPVSGGGGDIVANALVLGQRFDFLTFDSQDLTPGRGSADESGKAVQLQDVANSRATLGMFGSGYIEMLARQITADLQSARDQLTPGQQSPLESKGLSFGVLRRGADGTWDTSLVEGLPAPSLRTLGTANPPSLIVRPFHQVGAVVSLREFSNNAFNHHHGMQSAERFGVGADPDGDGVSNELTRADITAATLWQATLPVPGRRIPRKTIIEDAVMLGEQLFTEIGCARCHIPALPLTNHGWYFVEPNPFNPPGNLQPGETPDVVINLNSSSLPGPRLRSTEGATWVPAFTDFKLHDITSGPNDPNHEPLDQLQPAGSAGFFAGNSRFLTKKLWGAASEPPYFHHGMYTTLREATLAHAGESEEERQQFEALAEHDKNAVIEFLKSMQVLPPGSTALAVDENDQPRNWPPNR